MKDASICTVFSKDRKHVLLIKRRDVPVWVLPGGGIENGETPEDACAREVFEETGFSIHIERKVGEYRPCNRLTTFTHLYEGRVIKGEAKLSAESQQVAFFSIEKLPALLPSPYAIWIKEALENFPFVIQRKLTEITYNYLAKQLVKHPILVTRFLLTKLGVSWPS